MTYLDSQGMSIQPDKKSINGDFGNASQNLMVTILVRKALIL